MGNPDARDHGDSAGRGFDRPVVVEAGNQRKRSGQVSAGRFEIHNGAGVRHGAGVG